MVARQRTEYTERGPALPYGYARIGTLVYAQRLGPLTVAAGLAAKAWSIQARLPTRIVPPCPPRWNAVSGQSTVWGLCPSITGRLRRRTQGCHAGLQGLCSAHTVVPDGTNGPNRGDALANRQA